MLQLKSIGTPLVLAFALLTMTGCEQAEKSAQAVLDQAAESAKEVIDQSADAAHQALNEAMGIEDEAPEKDQDKNETQDI